MNNGIAAINYKVQNVWMKNTTYIEAVYSGTRKFHDSSINATNILNITKGIVTLTLDKTNITAKAGQTITLRAKVVDSNGDRINTDKVIFKLNGKTLKDSEGNTLYAQVIDGDAVVEYTIPTTYNVKTYTITAVYGLNYYERTETNGTLTLEKKGIIINTDSIKTADGKTTIKATITDETGELLVSSTKLAFKANGKTILNNVTSNKGKIDISFDNTLKSGLYELLIISRENGIYKSGKMNSIKSIIRYYRIIYR